MPQPVATKRGETFVARLYEPDGPDGRWRVDVVRLDGVAWRGSAWFPEPMYEEAVRRVDGLETDVDVEDLLREWGGEEALGDFQETVAYDEETR